MLKKLLITLICISALILIFIISFWLTVSEEKLLSWAHYQLNRLSPQQITVVIEGMKTRVLGLDIDQIELTNPAHRESLLTITDLQVRLEPAALILRQELPFQFKAYGGSGSGAFQFFPTALIRLTATNLELNWVPALRRSKILKSNPKLGFSGDYEPAARAGNLKIEVADLRISGDEAQTLLTVSLPDTDLDTVKAEIRLDKDQLEMAIDTQGDINLSLTGSVMGNWQRIQRSRVDMKLNAGMKPAYQSKLGFINSILDSYRSQSGDVSIHLTGNLMLPQIKKI